MVRILSQSEDPHANSVAKIFAAAAVSCVKRDDNTIELTIPWKKDHLYFQDGVQKFTRIDNTMPPLLSRLRIKPDVNFSEDTRKTKITFSLAKLQSMAAAEGVTSDVARLSDYFTALEIMPIQDRIKSERSSPFFYWTTDEDGGRVVIDIPATYGCE